MQEMTRRKHWHMVVLPIVAGIAIALLALWPQQSVNLAPLVRPPVAEAGVPGQDIVSVARGQAVGAEAYWKGFRLNSGWSLVETANYSRYKMVADVTNESDTPDVAQVLVTIRIADRTTDVLYCKADLKPGETKPLVCAETGQLSYNSHWNRITLSAM